MNEQLQTALSELLSKTVNGIDSASEFIQTELPDVIQQLLSWYMIYGLIQFIASIGILLLPCVVYKIVEKVMRDNDLAFCIAGASSIITTMIGLIMFNLEWLKILIAPKIWLIEYATSLAK